MRRGEIMNLTWDRVDLHRRAITLRPEDTKSQERRSAPIVGHAHEVLKELSKVRRIDTHLVFPAPVDGRTEPKPIDITSAWERALKKAGIEDFRFHDLRHTAASYLAMNGATLAEIAEVLGHKTLQMVKRYAHLTESHTSKVVERMNRAVFQT
jgi:integrase